MRETIKIALARVMRLTEKLGSLDLGSIYSIGRDCIPRKTLVLIRQASDEVQAPLPPQHPSIIHLKHFIETKELKPNHEFYGYTTYTPATRFTKHQSLSDILKACSHLICA